MQKGYNIGLENARKITPFHEFVRSKFSKIESLLMKQKNKNTKEQREVNKA